MNYEDEPYVRLYIRRTATNRRLGWEGRAVMHEMLYEFDKAGLFELGGDAAEAIEVVTRLPHRVIVAGLERLLKTGTWEVRGGVLIWPKFVEAQTAARSDKQRQRESRAKRRDSARAGDAPKSEPKQDVPTCDEPSPVTNCHDESRAVTDSHEPSQNVTLYSAKHSLAGLSIHTDTGEPSVGELSEGPSNAQALQAKAIAYLDDPTRGGLEFGPPDTWPEVRTAFEDFESVWPGSGKLRSRDKRAVQIIERFAEGTTPEDLAIAARGAKLDSYIAGNSGFQTVQTIWRDPGQIDRFRRLHASPPVQKRAAGDRPNQPSYGVKMDMEVTEA